jgi:hypothetical protein
MYRTFLPSEPKKSKKSKEKLSDATLRSGRNTGYVDIDVDATVDVLAKALTLFVYRSKEPITFTRSGGSGGGLRIEEKMEGKGIHEVRCRDRGNNNRDVWAQVVFLHKRLLARLRSNNASDESSVTKILESTRGYSAVSRHPYGVPNKRIVTSLSGAMNYGWSPCEAALFVLCVKDAATMDNKLDFWLINARSGSLKRMKTKDGKTITVW